MRLVYARDNDLTYNSIRFKKPLDNFFYRECKENVPEEYLVRILAVKGSSERFSCLEFILKNTCSTLTSGSRLKTYISL